MTLRQIRILLYGILLGVTGLTLTSILISLTWPLNQARVPDLHVDSDDATPPEPPTNSERHAVETFQAVWNKKLQQRLTDAKQIVEKAPEKPKPAPTPTPEPVRLPAGVKLLGTMIEGGAERAILELPNAGVTVVKVGDVLPTVSSAIIERIDRHEVTVQYRQTTQQIKLPDSSSRLLERTDGR